jgi:hypothetical protein
LSWLYNAETRKKHVKCRNQNVKRLMSSDGRLPDHAVQSSTVEGARDQVLTALWRVASLTISSKHFQPILDVDAITNLHPSPLTSSATALCKTVLVNTLEHSAFSNPLGHPLLPTKTAIAFPDELPDEDPLSEARRYDYFRRARIFEAIFICLAEFLDSCTSNFTPYKATNTIRRIGSILSAPYHPYDMSAPYATPIHDIHQLRLAGSMHRMFKSDNPQAIDLLDVTIACRMFDVYAGSAPPSSYTWLDNSTARCQIAEILTDRLSSSSPKSSLPMIRMQAILRGLESLHAN